MKISKQKGDGPVVLRGTPAPVGGPWVCVPDPLLTQLPAHKLSGSRSDGPRAGCLPPDGRPGLGSGLLASVCSSPACCRRLGSEPLDRSVSLLHFKYNGNKKRMILRHYRDISCKAAAGRGRHWLACGTLGQLPLGTPESGARAPV